MANRVKGITVEIGGDTTGLDKALAKTNKKIQGTQSQLKDVEKLLKLDPGNAELIAQKQRLLGDAVAETGEKLQALRDAEQQVQKQFKQGKVSQDQYDALKREIIQTERQLNNFRSAAKETNKTVDKIDESPVEDVTSAAKKAADALDDAGNEAADFGDVLSAGAIIEGAKAIAGAVGSMAEETAEYRKIMGTLDVSSAAAGFSADETAEAFSKLYGVLGDDQTTATTIANLQAVAWRQSDLLRLIDQVTGAWAKYGDSIPIDGLAESINETAKTGKVTGTLADVLNWAGESEDDFNESLEACNMQAERAVLIYKALSSQGLEKMGESWREQNASIVSANDAQARYMENAARLGDAVSPGMVAIKEGMAGLLEVMAEILEKVDMDAVADGINKFFEVLEDGIQWVIENKDIVAAILAGILGTMATLKAMKLATKISAIVAGVTSLSAAFPALGGAIAVLTNPIALVVGAITALVALVAISGDEIQEKFQALDDFVQGVFATDFSETFGPVLGDILNTFVGTVKSLWDALAEIFNGIIDFIRGVFTGDWKRAWKGVTEIFKGIFDKLVAIAKAPLNGIIALINGMINGINWVVSKINDISFKSPITGKVIGFNLPQIGNIPYLANGGQVLSGSAVVGEAGPELLTVAGGRTIVQPLSGGEAPRTAGGLVFNQTIYSPRALNAYEIYRQTQNEGRMIARQIRRGL